MEGQGKVNMITNKKKDKSLKRDFLLFLIMFTFLCFQVQRVLYHVMYPYKKPTDFRFFFRPFSESLDDLDHGSLGVNKKKKNLTKLYTSCASMWLV